VRGGKDYDLRPPLRGVTGVPPGCELTVKRFAFNFLEGVPVESSMNSMMVARVLRVFAVLGLLMILGELQHATSGNIEIVFAVEMVLILVLILTTRIIELHKSETTTDEC
jgi:hypothetical protein